MLSIIVLEDDALQRHRVSRLLDEAVEESKAVVDGITFYEQGQELLDTDRDSGKSMVYLLDIDLKNQTKQGLDIGLEIRKEDLKAQIAFVTAYSEFMPLTFRYKIQALDFVDKSMDDVDLKRALVELLDFAQSQVEQETKAQSLTVKTDKNDVNLLYEDILYIETAPVPHKLIAHTKLNLVEFYGKIAFADPNISSSSLEQLINMLYACRDEDEWGWKYVEALCRQLDGKLLTSSSAVYNGVANGEFVAGLTFEEAVAGSMDDGKHVAIVYMKEGVISTPDGVYLIQNAPHRDEAVEFLNFVTGYDAQYMITAQLNRRSVRVDVPATDKLPAKDTLPMLQPDSAEIESHRNEWLAQFNQIWKECAHE